MDDVLIMYYCENCGEEYYFSPDSLPGGNEHCAYCEECCGKLVRSDKEILTMEGKE